VTSSSPAAAAAADAAGRLYAFGKAYVSEVGRDRLVGLSAETAFFAVLSIFPGLLVMVGLLGLLDVLIGAELAAEAQQRVVGGLSLVLTDQASDAVAAVEELFEERRGGLVTFASVGALVTLSGAFAIVVNALNLVHDSGESRSFLRRRLLGFVLALGSLLLLVVVLVVFVVGPLLGRGEDLADLIGLGGVFVFVWDVVRMPVLALVLLLWVTALLRYAPACRIPWRDALPGGLLTVLLWLLATAGFRFYLEVVAGENPVLGAFGGGAIVMTWVFLLSFGLLLGGELNATLAQYEGPDDEPPDPDPEAAPEVDADRPQPDPATSQSAP
jgi:membrane protein